MFSREKLKPLLPDWRTFLSGVLIVLAFPTWDIQPLIWFALVPWFVVLVRARSGRAAFAQGVWLSVFMSLGGFYWVASVLKQFAGLPWAVAIAGLLLFSLIGQPQFWLFAPLYRAFRVKNAVTAPGWRGLGVAFALAFFYSGLDWLLPKLFVDTFGHAFYQARNLRQAADLAGATLLTWLVFLVNEAFFCFWILWERREKRGRQFPWQWYAPALKRLAVAWGLVAAFHGYGVWRGAEIRALQAAPPKSVQMGVIQANIGDFDKIAAERGLQGAARKVLDTFFNLSAEAMKQTPRPDALVWPETSYPSTFRTPYSQDDRMRDAEVERFTKEHGVPLLFGGYDHFDSKDFNAFFFLDPAGNQQVYRKNVLLLWGEYIPGAETFPWIKDTFPQVGNFGRGVGPEVLQIPVAREGGVEPVPVGPIICYEALFPNYILAAARKGSKMILNITNDSWFGPNGEPQLHLSLTTFRSIEARLPQLRSTNTGISALIMPDGEITHPTALFRPEILNVSVPLLEPVWTLMLAWGDWFGPFAFLAGALGLALAYRSGRPRQVSKR